MGGMLKLDPEGAGKLMTPPTGPNGQVSPGTHFPTCLFSLLPVVGKAGAESSADPDGACFALQAMPNPMAQMQGGPLVLARNFAVLTGVQAGLNVAIKQARGGKEDIRGSWASHPSTLFLVAQPCRRYSSAHCSSDVPQQQQQSLTASAAGWARHLAAAWRFR